LQNFQNQDTSAIDKYIEEPKPDLRLDLTSLNNNNVSELRAQNLTNRTDKPAENFGMSQANVDEDAIKINNLQSNTYRNN
jgi:hypothetical protein